MSFQTDQMHHSRLLTSCAALVLLAVSGCGATVERQYVWTRQQPAVGRRSPTTHVVRLNVNPEERSVVWFEDVHDNDGDLGRTTYTWTGCTVLDDRNWVCKTGVVLGTVVPNDIEMKDGRLHQSYWGEERDFVQNRRLFGVSF